MGLIGKDSKGSDLTHSPRRRRMAGLCAFPSSRNLLAHAVWRRQHRVEGVAQRNGLFLGHRMSLALARRRLLRLPPDAILSTLLIAEALREIWITNQRCARLQTINQAIKKTNGRRIGDANPSQRVSRLPWWISGKFPTGATCVA
jgi:hypothetical protein